LCTIGEYEEANEEGEEGPLLAVVSGMCIGERVYQNVAWGGIWMDGITHTGKKYAGMRMSTERGSREKGK
jgi:hypothetical protein